MLGFLLDLVLTSAWLRPKRRPPPPAASPEMQARMEKIARLYSRWSERNGWEGDDGEWRGRLDGREATLRPGLDSIQPGGVELSVVVNHTEQPRLLTPLERGSTEVDHALAPFLDRDELQSIALFSEGVRVRFVPLTRPELVEEQTRQIVQTVVDHVATNPYR